MIRSANRSAAPAAALESANIRAEGTGPPLIYVPGLDGTGELFYRQIPVLSPRFRVVTYRLRDSARRMSELVSDVGHMLDAGAPGNEPAILVGESFGGALSMHFALAHPERVRALVILNSFASFTPRYRLHLAMGGVRAMPWEGMRLVRRVAALRLHSAHTERSEVERFLTLTRSTTREGYLNRLRMLTTYDLRAELHALRVPVLYLAADRDHLIPSVAEANFMASRVPRATVRVLRGHGHSCFLSHDVNLDTVLSEWPDLPESG